MGGPAKERDVSGEYDLAELCRAAGVTQRTVRYYIQQGLLEPPDSRGPRARYGEGHLQRLRLIRLLQRRHLPLAEIRQMIDELSDGGVEEALGEASADEPSSALDYIAALRGSATQPQPWRSWDAHARLALPSQSTDSVEKASGQVVSSPPAAAGQRAGESFGRRSQWEHIVLGPNVELQIRRPLSKPENRAVERLLEAARGLFAQESKEES
jgi:DNA-binding transcriptional MerR regulator